MVLSCPIIRNKTIIVCIKKKFIRYFFILIVYSKQLCTVIYTFKNTIFTVFGLLDWSHNNNRNTNFLQNNHNAYKV